MMTLSKIMQALTRLAPADRDKVVAKLLFLRDTERAQPGLIEDDFLLDGFFYVLRERGLMGDLKRVSVATVKGMAPEYFAQSQVVRDILLKDIRVELSPIERLRLGRIVAEALVERLTNGQRKMVCPHCSKEFKLLDSAHLPPPSLRALLQHVSEALVAFDDTCPGWLAAGKVGFFLKSMDI